MSEISFTERDIQKQVQEAVDRLTEQLFPGRGCKILAVFSSISDRNLHFCHSTEATCHILWSASLPEFPPCPENTAVAHTDSFFHSRL